MNIVYINSFYAPDEIGGAEKSVRFLAETLQAQGHQTTVITLGREDSSSQLNGVRIERIAVPNLYYPADAGAQPGWKKLLWHSIDSFNPRAAQRVGALLDALRPDVVHTNNLSGLSTTVWGSIHRRHIPLVHTLRDYYLLCPNTAMFKGGKPCETRCGSCKALSVPRFAASKDVDMVVGNSRFILDKHVRFGLFRDADKRVIYNAYSPSKDENHRPSDALQFGFIGRLAPSKGLELLIEAVRLAKPKQAIRVLIAGEGDPAYVAALQASAAGLPIAFLGRMKPEDFYSQLHWTVVPSIWDEPLARVLFESFAHGVPVLGTSTGGTPELVHPGLNGYLFSAQSPASLTTLLEDASAMSAQAYQALSERARHDGQSFLPQAVSDNYMSAYQAVMVKRSAIVKQRMVG
ncbi:MAG: glycosyltransferase family 4 protein [Acidobacteriota bacterium]